MIEITVRDGIGARVTTLANALSSGEEVAFGWDANEHLPLAHEVVFPRGIAGVQFVPAAGDGCFTDWNAQPFFSWAGADDRALANAAYGVIIGAMAGAPVPGMTMAVLARFWRNPHASWETLADKAIATAREAGADTVFLLSDRYRWELRCKLIDAGIQVSLAGAAPLSADLDRTAEEMAAFLTDWKTVVACPLIVAIDGPTCLLNPARAAGRTIVYA